MDPLGYTGLITIMSGLILLHLSMKVYSRTWCAGRRLTWLIIFLTSLTCILAGSNNFICFSPALNPLYHFQLLTFITLAIGYSLIVIWLLYCLKYAKGSEVLTRGRVVLLFLSVYIFFFFHIVRNYLYQAEGFSDSVIIQVLSILEWVGYAYILAMLFLGIIILLNQYRFVSTYFRHQIIFLVIAASLPTIVEFADLLQLFPITIVDGIDFSLSGFMFAFGLLHYDILKYTPVFREKFFGIMDSGLVAMNRNLQIVDLNPAAQQFLHVPLNDAFGRKPSDISTMPAAFRKVLEHPETRDFPHFSITNGDTRWYRITARWEESRIGMEGVYLVVITDITHNVNLEKEVHLSQTRIIRDKGRMEQGLRYREFFMSNLDAILILSEGRVVECNPVAIQMFGHREEEIIGKEPVEFSSARQRNPDDVPEKLQYSITLAAAGTKSDFTWVFSSREGEIDTGVRLSRLTVADQILVEMSIRDLSELLAAERAVRKENRCLEKMLSHDIFLWHQVSAIIGEDSDATQKIRKLEGVTRQAKENLDMIPAESDKSP